MQKRRAFTLVEVILAVFIFSYMATSMATIYGTANRHMFQNYRRNIVKTNVVIAMRAVQNGLTVATRVDLPAAGAQGETLAFASNIDQTTGCYPVNPAVETRWHYFCLANDPDIPGTQRLFYHTNSLAGGPACSGFPSPCPSCWTAGSYVVPACGVNGGGGQRVVLLMSNILPRTNAAYPRDYLFSRRALDGAVGAGSVRVKLRSSWAASTRGFGASQRDVDFLLDTLVTSQRSFP